MSDSRHVSAAALLLMGGGLLANPSVRLTTVRGCLLVMLMTGLMQPAAAIAADDKVHAFFARELWTGASEPIINAVMLVSEGRVTAVGKRGEINVPPNAVSVDLSAGVVVPGFVIAESSIGIAQDDERTLTPEVRASDGFDLFADYSRYLSAGITTVQISPGQQRLMPGQTAVVKLAGEDPGSRILSSAESLRIILSQESASAPRIYEPPVGAVSVDNPLDPTIPQVSQSLSARMAGLRAVFAAVRAGKQDESGRLDLDAVRSALKSGRVRISARTEAEIRAAGLLFDEIQKGQDRRLHLILSGCDQLKTLLQNDARVNSTGFVLRPRIRPGQVSNPIVPDSDAEPEKDIWEFAAELLKRGAKDSVAITADADSDLDDILFLAGLFRRGGLSDVQTLQLLTSNPAKILGVGEKVGTLASGHDADFVVLTGAPFESGTLVQSTWVNGRQVFSREASPRQTLLKALSVYVDGQHQINDGSVLIAGSQIRAVGSKVSAPADVTIKTFPNAVIVPGFVDLGTGLGFGGSVSRISLATKLGDRLASDDPAIAYARQGGVTTAVFTSSDSPAPLLVFKLGDKPRLLKEPAGVRFSMPANLTSGVPALSRTLAAGKAYADAWSKYEADMVEFKKAMAEYESELARYEAKQKTAADKAAADKAAIEKTPAATNASGGNDAGKSTSGDDKSSERREDKPASDSQDNDKEKQVEDKQDAAKNSAQKSSAASDTSAKKTEDAQSSGAPVKPVEPKKPAQSAAMEPYRELMAGRIPAVVEANDLKAVSAAVKLFREDFKLTTILVGAEQCYRLADDLRDSGVSVSVGPTMVRRVENELVNLPQVLASHQIPFAFQSNATTGVRQLPLAVQYAVFKGLSAEDALNGFTSSAAELLSLQSMIGSLEAGKDADLVVLSGPPFESASEVIAVMIDGEWVYERGENP